MSTSASLRNQLLQASAAQESPVTRPVFRALSQRFRPIARPELGEQVAQVKTHGARVQDQLICGFAFKLLNSTF